jgi:hypothetical protein
MLAVEVVPETDHLIIGRPRILFRLSPGQDTMFDVTSDGQRILLAISPSSGDDEALTLVQNFRASLE